jgi:monoamine oxidase
VRPSIPRGLSGSAVTGGAYSELVRDGALTRRRFLVGAAGGAAAIGLGAGVTLARRGGGERRVIIVGAGFAGLSAAYQLGRSGFEVTVLEARERIGGRVFTVRDPFEAGQHGEAGGEAIDRAHRVILGYARELGLGLEDTRRGPGGAAITYVRGRRLRFSELRDPRATRPFYSRLYELARRIDPADPAARGAQYDSVSAADLIDRVGVRGTARFVLETQIRDDYGVEASEISLLGMAAIEAAYFGAPGGTEVFRIRGGNSRLADTLASRSGAEILTSRPVSEIERSPEGVRVHAGGEVFEGESCVLATPLPAMRAIAFEPPLPAALAGAVAEMQYARVAKTLVQYRTRFWRRRGLSGDTYTDLPMGSAWEATDRQRGREGVLIAYAAGWTHDRLAAEAAGEPVAEVTGELDRVYPGSGRLALEGATVDWAAEPYSGGCWMQAAPGQVVPFWRAVREPVGRIVLAGEHTARFAGYMEGALASGITAAQTIRDAG